jgi:hypothetical protein
MQDTSEWRQDMSQAQRAKYCVRNAQRFATTNLEIDARRIRIPPCAFVGQDRRHAAWMSQLRKSSSVVSQLSLKKIGQSGGKSYSVR